jgi:Carboxypeptidase regulatory-like domain
VFNILAGSKKPMRASRNRLLIAALIGVGLVAIWWIASREPGELPSKVTTTRGSGSQNESPTPTAASQATPPPKPSPPASFEAQERGFITAFKTPIAFYGRVIDQHGNPVPEADVKLSANDKAFGGRPTEYTRKTDAAGAFSIAGIGGLTLAVEVSKPGYRVIPPAYGKVTSSGLFEYGLSSRGPYQSSKDAPTIFTLHKIGVVEPLVKVGEKNFRIARDGSPLSISLDEQGGHQVVLRCWNKELQRPSGQRQYDWLLEITVPNGGLVARKDAFEFEALEDGYSPSDTVEMPASLGNQWRSFAERAYFFRFEDGTFARANLRMRAGGDHFVVWESFFNPKSGSRNLEHDPKQTAAP